MALGWGLSRLTPPEHQHLTCSVVKNFLGAFGARPWLNLRINPLMVLDRVILLLLLLLQLLGNGSCSSSGEAAPVPRQQRAGAVAQVGARDTRSSSGRADPAAALQSGKVCLFLGYRLSGRKDGHCQGFYWIPVKGIEGVSCLLSFPAPAVVQEGFLPSGGREGRGDLASSTAEMEFQSGCLVSWAGGIRRGRGWKSTERGLEGVERTRTLRLKACGKCCLSSSAPSGAGAGYSTRPGLDKVLTVLGGNLEREF